MTQSTTPKLTVTQTGGAQSIELSASASSSQTPNLSVVRVGDNQTITLGND